MVYDYLEQTVSGRGFPCLNGSRLSSKHGTLSGTLPALVKLGPKVIMPLIFLLSPIFTKNQLFLTVANRNIWLRWGTVGCFRILPQSAKHFPLKAMDCNQPRWPMSHLGFALFCPSAEQVVSGSSEMFSPFGHSWICRGVQLPLRQQKSYFWRMFTQTALEYLPGKGGSRDGCLEPCKKSTFFSASQCCLKTSPKAVWITWP